MNNLEKYNFSDFTLDNYRQLLLLALSNYTFRLFNEEYYSRSILLRHDLEFSIPIALKMAEIEAEQGIKSTYFIQLHSEFYNILEKGSIEAIKQIKKLGHQLGLHFDSHFWGIDNEDQLDINIHFDKRIIEDYTGAEVKAFSFHNNTEFTLSCHKERYGGLLNVYSDFFRKNYGYNADSLGYWRYERLEDRLREANDDALQILVHDGMWQDEILPPRRRVYKVVDENVKSLKIRYDLYLKEVGAKNIDWDEVL